MMSIKSRLLCPETRLASGAVIACTVDCGASRIGIIMAPAQPDRHCGRVDFLNNADAVLPEFSVRHASKERLAAHPVVVLAVLAVEDRVAERESSAGGYQP